MITDDTAEEPALEVEIEKEEEKKKKVLEKSRYAGG